MYNYFCDECNTGYILDHLMEEFEYHYCDYCEYVIDPDNIEIENKKKPSFTGWFFFAYLYINMDTIF